MTIGEISCLKSSINQMLKELSDNNIDEKSKLEFIKNELQAMKRLIENSNKR